MSDFYKPRRAYELNEEYNKIIGRRYFIIAGQLANGTNCWYKCDQEGNIEDYNRWYSMGRINGKMVAFLEAIN